MLCFAHLSAALALMLAQDVSAGSWGPAGVPASFDCGMRKMAYAFGRKLLPRQKSFESLYYALDLNSEDCHAEPGLLEGAEHEYAQEVEAVPTHAVFVDHAEGADDAEHGSQDRPLKTVRAALERVAGQPDAQVVLRGGVHYLSEPLLLGSEHSGLTIRAHPGETPVVSGGQKLEIKEWQPFQAKGGNVYVTNIKGQVSEVPGLQLNGVRATRARYPNLPGGIEVSPGYSSMISQNDATWTPPDFDKFGKVKYFTDHVPDHQRNTSTDAWFQSYMIGVDGLCSVYDPPVSYWCSEKPSGGGAFAFRTPSGMTPKQGVLKHAPYKDVSEAIINVWRPARWANWMFEVGKYDSTTNNFTFGRGGNQGARGENTGGDWFIENVFEELDHPGEFFWDKASGNLYLYHNGTGSPPLDLEVVVPQQRVLMNITGTQWDPVRNVTVDGVTFKAARYTYMDPHGVPSAGDWALDRMSAVFLQGTAGVTVKNSVFERLDGNALMISGYNRNTTVVGNDFSYIGGNAMVSWGYTNETENSGYPYYTPRTNFPDAGIDGTDGNHPLYNKIVGNSAREVGLYEKQSSFYMQAKTAQSTITGNVFFNGPRAGINYNDGFGGGDELARNLVFSACRESGDHGPFNSWDRQPYLTTVRTGEPSMVMAWRTIHHNFFLDNYSPQENIDNDDGSCYYRSYNNFLVYGDNGMKNDFGGHDNWHFRNIFAFSNQALGVVPTLAGHEDHFESNYAVLRSSSAGSPQCGTPVTQMSGNRYFTPDGKVSLCGKPLAEVQREGLDHGSTVAKTPKDDVILGLAHDMLFGASSSAAPEAVIVV
jgi:hypothetical protein